MAIFKRMFQLANTGVARLTAGLPALRSLLFRNDGVGDGPFVGYSPDSLQLSIAATSKGTTQILKWILTCETNGQSCLFKGDEEVPIRRLQVSAVDELFEDLP